MATTVARRDRLRVGVLYYRAHEISGNAGFAHALVDAIDATGDAVGVPIFASSLRSAPQELFDAMGTLDALVVSVLAAGGIAAVGRQRGRRRRLLGHRAHRRARHPGPAGAVPDVSRGRTGWPPTTVSRRWTRPPRSRSRSSTAASSPRRSRSRRSTTTGSRTTSPTPSAARGSRASPSTTPDCAASPTPKRGSRSCSRRIRPSTRGSATPSASTPRPRRCGCCACCAEQGTTSATAFGVLDIAATRPRPATR